MKKQQELQRKKAANDKHGNKGMSLEQRRQRFVLVYNTINVNTGKY